MPDPSGMESVDVTTGEIAIRARTRQRDVKFFLMLSKYNLQADITRM